MMKLSGKLLVPTAVLATTTAFSLENLDAESPRPYLKEYMSGEDFFPGEWGRDISYLLPFKWKLEDGRVCAYFALAEHTGKYGSGWFLHILKPGFPECGSDAALKHPPFFHPWNVYAVDSFSGERKLVFFNAHERKASGADTGERTYTLLSWWRSLDVSPEGEPVLGKLDGWPNAFLADASIKKLHRVIPYEYKGSNAVIVAKSNPVKERLDEIATGKGRWTLSHEQEKMLAGKHAAETSRTIPEAKARKIYIIPCDADMDGACDAYVSSDIEANDDGLFEWTLYVRRGGGFEESESSYSKIVAKTQMTTVPAKIAAARDMFFRIDQTTAKNRERTPAYVAIAVKDATGKMELWDYVAATAAAGTGNRACCDKRTMVRKPPENVTIRSFWDLFLSVNPELASVARLDCDTVDLE